MADENQIEADSIREEAKKAGIKTGKPQDTHTDDDEEVSELEDDTDESEDEDEGDKKPENKSDDDEDESEEDEAGEDEDESEESESEDEESEDEEDEDAPKTRRPRKYIPKEDYARRKAEWDKEKAELQKQLKLAQTKAAGPSEARKKLYEKLKAADPKFDPSSLDDVINTLRDELAETTGSLPKELADKLKAVDEFMESQKGTIEKQAKIQKDRQLFSEGWKDIQAELETAFPKMTDDEKEAAKTLLGKLWRSKEFHNADVFRVFHKNRSKFEEIMSPHESGLETGRTQGHQTGASKGKVKLSKNPSAKELAQAEKQMADITGESEEFTELDNQL